MLSYRLSVRRIICVQYWRGRKTMEYVHLTPANEDYLEALVEIEETKGEFTEPPELRSVDLANLLGVSKASVNKALQTLRDAGYIEQERYGRITITDVGRAYGRQIWSRHRILRDFLINDLGVEPEIANDEACEMEHTISQDTMDRWVKWLDALHKDEQ